MRITHFPSSWQTGQHTPLVIPDNSFTGEITDTNILKSMNRLADVEVVKPGGKKTGTDESKKKTIITTADLDDYASGGIR